MYQSRQSLQVVGPLEDLEKTQNRSELSRNKDAPALCVHILVCV